MQSAFQLGAFQVSGFQIVEAAPQRDIFGGGRYEPPLRRKIPAGVLADDDEVLLMFAQFITNEQRRK